MSNRLFEIHDAQLQRKNEVPNPLGEGTVPLGAYDKTLPQIKNNPHLHDLFFGSFLNTADTTMAQEIVLALEEKPPRPWTPEQRAFLERERKNFNRTMKHTDLVREAISDQEIMRMAGRDPRIQEILGQTNNTQEAGVVLRSQLDRLAVQDPVQFQNLIRNLKDAHTLATSERAKRAEANVQERLSAYNISEEQYRKAIESSISATRITDQSRKELKKLAHSQMGTFMKIIDSVGGLASRSRASKLSKAFAGEHVLFKERQEKMQSVGTVLLGTLDPDMRIAIQEALREGRRPEVRDERTVKTLDDYRTVRERAKTEHTPQARATRFQGQLRAEVERLHKAPSEFSDTEINDFNERYMANEEKLHQEPKATGLFSALIKLLWPDRTEMRHEASDMWRELRRTP